MSNYGDENLLISVTDTSEKKKENRDHIYDDISFCIHPSHIVGSHSMKKKTNSYGPQKYEVLWRSNKIPEVSLIVSQKQRKIQNSKCFL